VIVTIYHNRHDPHPGHIPFYSEVCEECWFERAYEYEIRPEGSDPRGRTLETIWRQNNHVDGTEVVANIIPPVRSLSVGDVVGLDGSYYAVARIGFVEAGLSDLTLPPLQA